MRYPLVDGQGNFGSVDGDPAAAMRYTEARMTAISAELLADIDKDTVDFEDNYDGTKRAAVGPPGQAAEPPRQRLLRHRRGHGHQHPAAPPGRDRRRRPSRSSRTPSSRPTTSANTSRARTFPTGATIFRFEQQRNALTGQHERVDAIRQMYANGRGRVVMRAVCAFEETRGNRVAIVVTELPYQVNKAQLVEKIADLVGAKKLEGIADLRDESDRDGMRVVIECKRDANPHKVLNNLFKHTPLQLAFNMNMLALVDGQPQTLPLKAVLQHYIDYRRDVVRRRTEYDLARARERAHILEGLKKALDNLDAVIRTIRESKDVETAKQNLVSGFDLSEIQAQAILDMRLARLAALERQKIEDEYLAGHRADRRARGHPRQPAPR